MSIPTNWLPGVGPVRLDLPEEPTWQTDPRLYREFNYGGTPTRLYTIGALAKALGKKTDTIRKWIRKGVIPEAGLKTAGIEGTLNDAGIRLFTEEQITALVRIGTECGVAGEGRRPASLAETGFPSRVWTLWSQKNW